jgi:fumarate reductase flavoprotein subunit
MKKLSVLVLALIMAIAPLAGCNSETPSSVSADNKSADIVVIGAGGAGMTAAIEAVQNGATNVVIVEKMPITGGNTVRSSGGLNAAPTKYQEAQGIKDSVELFVEDTMKGGKNLNNKDLVTTLVKNSPAAVDWVNDIGGDLSVVGMFGGASVKRIHRPSDTSAVGPMLVKTLNKKIAELGIPVLLNTKADEIVLDSKGAVAGVKVTDKDGSYTINTKAVVLATGGFSANSEMVVKYKPELKGFSTTNHIGATGDGIIMAEAIGADFVDMEQIQIHPTVNPDNQTLYTEGVRGNGAILVNKEGKRFIDELQTRDVVSAAILEQKDGQAYMIFDQKVRDSLKSIEEYFDQGIVIESDTIEGLAKKIGVEASALKETMDTYAGYQKAGKDTEFSRKSMEVPLTSPKFYAALSAPAVHHTMGGVKINTNAEVVNKDGKVIPGLFAGGEVTGGLHGGNRLGGNAVADIVIFGRISGSSAAKYVVANGGNTDPSIKVESAAAEVKPEVQGNYKDGTYTGTGKGKGGDLTVEVVVEGGNITKITLKEHSETPGIFEGAEKGVVAEIIKTQTTEVDVVAGASMTSGGIKEAVTNALKGAK